MSEKSLDVFGVGNAIVDILAHIPEESIGTLDLNKGSMTLMDNDRQSGVLHYLEGTSLNLASGGSAANTLVAIAQSGGTGVYTGKVAGDTHGEFYKKDMEEAGIGFHTPFATAKDLPTGTCVVLTTPDAERTMCTNLGISATLTKDDLDMDLLVKSKISYIEGYLWDPEEPRAACLETFEQSKKLGVKTAFTFSDSFLVDRFEDDFRKLASEYCDIIFCNADEARKFVNTDDVEHAAKEIGKMCELVFVTDGANGSFVIENGRSEKVGSFPVTAVDTVGAGDAFAGGTLFGLTNGMSPHKAARWGNYFASQVVSNPGPRLDHCMKEKVASEEWG